MREEGYYWVKINAEWDIAYWNDLYWSWTKDPFLVGEFDQLSESDIQNINETRILNPDEK